MRRWPAPKHMNGREDASWSKRNQQNEVMRLLRRKQIEGFPWDGIFESREDLDEYFSGDEIVCLLCGKRFRSLGMHLTKIHKTNAEDYKKRYGIPMGIGLAGNSYKNKISTATKERINSPSERKKIIDRMSSAREKLENKGRKWEQAHAIRNDIVKNTKGNKRNVIFVERACCICSRVIMRDSSSPGPFKCGECQRSLKKRKVT